MKISEYKQLFFSEAQEILSSLNNVLVDLEKNPQDSALHNELFRQSHTLKSMAQSMGYDHIAELTHSMESALALLRGGKLKGEKDTVDLFFDSVDALTNLLDEAKKGKTKKLEVTPLVDRFEKITSTPKQKRKPERRITLKSELDHTNRLPEKEGREEETPSPSYGDFQTVRVPLKQLDSLMDVTGELVINRIRLAQIAQTVENKTLEETVTQISRLTSQLQNQMMQVRLVPLEYIFTPYPRMVRNLAREQNKEVDLLIEGSHIGLDRSIQDEINEPLLHLLKNAVIHGIEEPEKREKLKKPKRGRIKLSAKRERNFVIIELSDDGRGMDVEEIKEVAIKTGVVTKEELLTLTPKQVVMLTTQPGYSRVNKITEAAGRGVGLNASRVKVESLGGTLEIETKPNQGTSLFIKLPLTMAIVQSMLVGIGDQTYCIPLSQIVETLRISPQEIKCMGQHEMISYRDTVLPLIRLREKFGFAHTGPEPKASDISSRIANVPVVVVEMGSKRAGLLVDSLFGQQEIVIKALSGMVSEIKGVSGATILGTGKVALVVDVGPLLKKKEMI
jgi:two-component system chemotaxis sensor kinase CheA